MNNVTKLRIRNITTNAALKFGSDAWVLKKRERQRLEVAQMKLLRHLLGITKLDKGKNQCIKEKREHRTVKEIKQYQKKWLQHLQRMDRNRLPRQALKYRPEGRRNIGRPMKRWRANSTLRIKEQGMHLTLNEHDDDDDDDDVSDTKHKCYHFTWPLKYRQIPNHRLIEELIFFVMHNLSDKFFSLKVYEEMGRKRQNLLL
jgi:hypothetical protein